MTCLCLQVNLRLRVIRVLKAKKYPMSKCGTDGKRNTKPTKFASNPVNHPVCSDQRSRVRPVVSRTKTHVSTLKIMVAGLISAVVEVDEAHSTAYPLVVEMEVTTVHPPNPTVVVAVTVYPPNPTVAVGVSTVSRQTRAVAAADTIVCLRAPMAVHGGKIVRRPMVAVPVHPPNPTAAAAVAVTTA